MKIIIRCDSSLKIGTGHAARCINLAVQLQILGHDISFACRKLNGNIIELIKKLNFRVIELSLPNEPFSSADLYLDWLAVPLDHEINEFKKIVTTEKPDWIICDHYSLPKSWEESYLSLGIKLFIIDDIFRAHHANALLDQNFSDDCIHPAFSNSTITEKLFIGPQYALLSNEFLKQSPKNDINEKVENILCFCGGSDPSGLTLRLVNIFLSLNQNINFNIVVGSHNPHLKNILLIAEQEKNFQAHVQTTEMAKLMLKADLFIGAGGITTWERCYIGLPSVIVSIADNQEHTALNLSKKNIQIYLGNHEKISDLEIKDSIMATISNFNIRKIMSRNCLDLKVSSKLPEVIKYFEREIE